jgi:hypothetical protein
MRRRRHRRRGFQHERLGATESTEAECLPRCRERNLRVLRALYSSSVLKKSTARFSGAARLGRMVEARLATPARAIIDESWRRDRTSCTRVGRPGCLQLAQARAVADKTLRTERAGCPCPAAGLPGRIREGKTPCTRAVGCRRRCVRLGHMAPGRTPCIRPERSGRLQATAVLAPAGKTPCTVRNGRAATPHPAVPPASGVVVAAKWREHPARTPCTRSAGVRGAHPGLCAPAATLICALSTRLTPARTRP